MAADYCWAEAFLPELKTRLYYLFFPASSSPFLPFLGPLSATWATSSPQDFLGLCVVICGSDACLACPVTAPTSQNRDLISSSRMCVQVCL